MTEYASRETTSSNSNFLSYDSYICIAPFFDRVSGYFAVRGNKHLLYSEILCQCKNLSDGKCFQNPRIKNISDYYCRGWRTSSTGSDPPIDKNPEAANLKSPTKGVPGRKGKNLKAQPNTRDLLLTASPFIARRH